MPGPSNRNGSGASREALVAITDAKPRQRRTGADVKAEWAPTDRIVFEPEREAITGTGGNGITKRKKRVKCPGA